MENWNKCLRSFQFSVFIILLKKYYKYLNRCYHLFTHSFVHSTNNYLALPLYQALYRQWRWISEYKQIDPVPFLRRLTLKLGIKAAEERPMMVLLCTWSLTSSILEYIKLWKSGAVREKALSLTESTCTMNGWTTESIRCNITQNHTSHLN